MMFVVRRARGGPWDWTRDMREQDGWDEHARFLDELVQEGFIILGGPLEGDREVLHIVDAPSEEAIRERLAQDNWELDGKLTTVSIESWTILLDGPLTLGQRVHRAQQLNQHHLSLRHHLHLQHRPRAEQGSGLRCRRHP